MVLSPRARRLATAFESLSTSKKELVETLVAELSDGDAVPETAPDDLSYAAEIARRLVRGSKEEGRDRGLLASGVTLREPTVPCTCRHMHRLTQAQTGALALLLEHGSLAVPVSPAQTFELFLALFRHGLCEATGATGREPWRFKARADVGMDRVRVARQGLPKGHEERMRRLVERQGRG